MAEAAVARAILLIDDNDALRRSLGRALERVGWSVEQAADGETGLRLVEQRASPYSLVITDLGLPRLDGWAVAETLAQCRPQQAVLCISGNPDACPAVGPHDTRLPILLKPFTHQTLTEAAELAMDQAAGLAELALAAADRGRAVQGEAERVRAEAVATRLATRDLVAYAHALRER